MQNNNRNSDLPVEQMEEKKIMAGNTDNYLLRQVRDLTESTYILRFDRNGMEFRAGQHITLGLPDDTQIREYSIYSTEQDDHLEVLIKEVDEGMVSKKLKNLKSGDRLNVDGAFGFFTLSPELRDRELLFIATGTGIAPFHSIIGSYPDLNFKLVHGIRHGYETYEKSFYPEERYISCTSRDNEGDIHGRVTDYLKNYPVNSDTLVYLCGNVEMIYDVYDLLTSKGFPGDNIRTEVYF